MSCPKKPDGWKPARLIKPHITAGPRAPDTGVAGHDPASRGPGEANGAISADIRKPGRPRTGFDKAAYNRDYMRKRRAAQKEAGK